MSSKQPMQADGAASKTARSGETPGQEKSGGESQGGAYPNPHSDKNGSKKGGKFDGGQSERAYHGTGQLGGQKTGEQPNAGSTE